MQYQIQHVAIYMAATVLKIIYIFEQTEPINPYLTNLALTPHKPRLKNEDDHNATPQTIMFG